MKKERVSYNLAKEREKCKVVVSKRSKVTRRNGRKRNTKRMKE